MRIFLAVFSVLILLNNRFVGTLVVSLVFAVHLHKRPPTECIFSVSRKQEPFLLHATFDFISQSPRRDQPGPLLLLRPLEVPPELHDVGEGVEEGQPVVLQGLVPLGADAVAHRDHKVRPHQLHVHREGAVHCNELLLIVLTVQKVKLRCIDELIFMKIHFESEEKQDRIVESI